MRPKRTFIQPGQKLELDLTPVERKAILDGVTLLPDEYDRLLKKIHPEQPLLLTLDELADFSGYVAADSNHTKNKKLRAVLDSAFEKMAVLLDTYTDHKPPAPKTTKKALVAEREKAERQKKISEQAAFLATWAAGVLQAADQKGAKNRVLESFTPGDLERTVLTTIDDVSPAVCKRLAAGKDDFTLGEVGGMLMAVAGELCVAPVQQQAGMLMVAHSLMTAMQDWVGEMMADEVGQSFGTASRRSKTVKKKPTKSSPRPRAGWTQAPARLKPSDAVYQFKITLLDTHPAIWRRIQVKDCFLEDLHAHIQAAMGWKNSHMHVFEIDGLTYGSRSQYGPDAEYEIIDGNRVLLSTLLPKSKARFAFRYTYDLGDNWEHEVVFEGAMTPPAKTKLPLCLEGNRACPPDDCGGVPGYEHMLQVLADPDDNEYDEMLEWAGKDFDPEAFDTEKATRRMRRGLRT